MFEDRSKGYDFKKIDKEARTKVMVEEKSSLPLSNAHQKLFGPKEEVPKEEIKEQIKSDIVKQTQENEVQNIKVDNLPSTNYLKQFENQVVPEEVEEVIEEEVKSEVDFSKLLDQASKTEVNNSVINKELKKAAPKPKKNYSFRIKLVTGVYCILVALFGGWVISNTINISTTNNAIYETTVQTSEVNSKIIDIIAKINQTDVNDDSILTDIISDTIEITPEEVTPPNAYEESSNWFDIICNWISSIFGG